MPVLLRSRSLMPDCCDDAEAAEEVTAEAEEPPTPGGGGGRRSEKVIKCQIDSHPFVGACS